MELTRRNWLKGLLALPFAPWVAAHLPKGVSKTPLWLSNCSTYRFGFTGFRPAVGVSLDEINRVTLAQLRPAVMDHYFRPSPLLTYLQEGRPVRSSVLHQVSFPEFADVPVHWTGTEDEDDQAWDD